MAVSNLPTKAAGDILIIIYGQRFIDKNILRAGEIGVDQIQMILILAQLRTKLYSLSERSSQKKGACLCKPSMNKQVFVKTLNVLLWPFWPNSDFSVALNDDLCQTQDVVW